MESRASFFADRRDRLASHLEDALAIIPAGREAIRNHDVAHPFRARSDFYYVSGFEEPDAIAILDPAHPDEGFVLFVRPKDPEREIWDGYRHGVPGAIEVYGADAAFPVGDFEQQLRERLPGRSAVYLPLDDTGLVNRVKRVLTGLRSLETRFGHSVPATMHDIGPLLGELRLVKTEIEVDWLRKASQLSAEGHREAMRFAAPGRYEYQVQAAMEYIWRQRGSTRDAYPSIVASGPNACVLHYTANDRRLEAGDLLLIDAGAEYRYYSTDITRTFPVEGTFSGPQRDIYDIVLAAQHAALAAAVPGETPGRVNDAAVATITRGLVELNLLPGPVDRALAMHHYRAFFMHGTGHWVGLDVHDAGQRAIEGASRDFRPGMALTVEPGIYIDPLRDATELTLLEHDLDAWLERRIRLGARRAKQLEAEERQDAETVIHEVPEELKGIGIRIEDVVVITEHGHEVLTGDVPSEPEEVESLSSEASELTHLEPL